jgi:hypothetical protein
MRVRQLMKHLAIEYISRDEINTDTKQLVAFLVFIFFSC